MNERLEMIDMAKSFGFDYAVPLECSTIVLLEEVRQMCASDMCRQYRKNWSCPPACGTLKECAERIRGYDMGILVQTTGKLEDSMDVEAMLETEERHKIQFADMYKALSKKYLKCLPMGTGCCTVCRNCTYPSSACRFPEKRISSMEAYGILVSDLCTKNHLKYYYGANTIAYTSCFLWCSGQDQVPSSCSRK